eukprot:scaffold20560_cov34-Tisochrysis_lutea.AAC.2
MEDGRVSPGECGDERHVAIVLQQRGDVQELLVPQHLDARAALRMGPRVKWSVVSPSDLVEGRRPGCRAPLRLIEIAVNAQCRPGQLARHVRRWRVRPVQRERVRGALQ